MLEWFRIIVCKEHTPNRSTTRVPDTSDTNATRVRYERIEWGSSKTLVLYDRHVCDTNVTRTTRSRHESKILVLITTYMKTYFHTPMLAIWRMKDYKEGNNFILRTTFWKCLVSMPKCVWKVHHKNWTL